VLIVLNETDKPQSFLIEFKGRDATATLPNDAVGTFVW
jgi:hypothetical protein